MNKVIYAIVPALGLFVLFGASVTFAQEQPDVVIVKYGKLMVKSAVPEAQIYVDDVYKGRSDSVIEDIPVGEHTISCRVENRSASGTFHIRKDEVLKLEARYEEGKLVPVVEREKVDKAEKSEPAKKSEPDKKSEPAKKPELAKKPEPAKKAKVASPKAEKSKKAVVEARRDDTKSPAEERRELHLGIIKVFFGDIDAQEVRINHKINPKVITKFMERKNQTGTYYLTKKNVLLCDRGPCEQRWSASFIYTDETEKSDTIGLTWKQTVYNGITPTGTSKRVLLFCVNSSCETLEDTSMSDTALSRDAGRYHLTWSKSSLVIRRSDLMKEVLDAGGTIESY